MLADHANAAGDRVILGWAIRQLAVMECVERTVRPDPGRRIAALVVGAVRACALPAAAARQLVERAPRRLGRRRLLEQRAGSEGRG